MSVLQNSFIKCLLHIIDFFLELEHDFDNTLKTKG